MKQQITIKGKIYTYKDVDITDYKNIVFNMLEQLQPMEYCRYYDKYIFKDSNNKACYCYVEDTNNATYI